MSERRADVSASLLGGAAGLAGSALLAAFASAAFPPIVLADAVVRLTPGGVATSAIEAFGHRALPLTVVATTGAFLAATAASGWIASSLGRRPGWNGAAIVSTVAHGLPYAVVAAVLLVDAPTDPVRSVTLLLPPVGLAVYVTWLRCRPAPDRPRVGSAPPNRSRRDLLAAFGLATFGLVVGWVGSVGSISRGVSRGGIGIRELDLADLPTIGPDASRFELPGLSPELTPTEDHYIVDTSIVDPMIDEDGWTLSIGGLVERPLELSYADLLRFPSFEQVVTMECISNEVGGDLISTARWGGVSLRDLLGRAGLRDGAVEIVSRGVEGYSDSIRVDQAMMDTALIAITMNGEPLPREHGFPARLLVPGLYGYKQPKWLEQITAVGTPHRGYWEARGWAKEGTVKTMSRIDTVATDGETLIAGGIAFAGDRGIGRVEYSTDDGETWGTTEAKDPLSPLSWRLWRASLGPDPSGPLVVRAVDGTGRVQTGVVSRPHPSGSTGWHSVTLG